METPRLTKTESPDRPDPLDFALSGGWMVYEPPTVNLRIQNRGVAMTTDAESVKQSWRRIRKWYEANLPDEFLEEFKNTAPPATIDEISDCESILGIKLPDSVRESYLIYNGDGVLWTFSFAQLSPLKRIATIWEERKAALESGEWADNDVTKCHRAIRKKYWDVKWIPIADNMSGVFFCVDLNPTKSGIPGQVFRFIRELGPVDRVANSFADMLLIFAERLEAGKYQWSHKYGGVWPVTGTPRETI